MSLLDRFMPVYRLRQVHRVAVAASPEIAYPIVRGVDAGRIAFVRVLFGARTMPDDLVARLRGAPPRPAPSIRVDDFPSEGAGFIRLGEEPGCEVVVGSVGKYWQPAIEFASITPASFCAFDAPGFGKVAWALRVDPREGGGSWITFDLRVGATDDVSYAKFQRYWLLIGRFSHAIRRAVMHMFEVELGAAAPDATRSFPGDEILFEPELEETHAVTIEAPPSRVWPWLAQIGARRAGWYSYDCLDNGGVPSAETIHPELQHVAVGDIIPGLPRSTGGFAVLRVERERLLVLGDPALLPGGVHGNGPPWSTTWAFVLEPIGTNATHLVVRLRAHYASTAKMAVIAPIMSAVHEVMERRQLRSIRRRVEGPLSA